MSLALVRTAGLAGAVHAGFGLYWALAGRWLLATVGQRAVDPSAERPLAAGITLGLVAAVTLLGATIPMGVAYGRVPWPWWWRGISWARHHRWRTASGSHGVWAQGARRPRGRESRGPELRGPGGPATGPA